MSRTLPTPSELDQLVGTLVHQWVDAKKAFTAYDVTNELRAQHSDIEIIHPDVRDSVYGFMSVEAGYYPVPTQFPNGALANQWCVKATPVQPASLIGRAIKWLTRK